MNETTKRYLFLIFRALVAVGGVMYIILTMTWHDSVKVPAGHPLLSQLGLPEKSLTMRVVDGDITSVDPTAVLSLTLDRASLHPIEARITRGQLGEGPNDLQALPAVTTELRGADWRYALLGLLLVMLIYPILTFRWWMLMRARGMDVTVGKTFSLTMVGCFFNYCMPGTTGGDVVKAYYAARGSGRRTDAVMSVVIDRVLGLLGLVCVASVAGLFKLDDKVVRTITTYLWLSIAGVVLFSAIYFSRRLRNKLGIDKLLPRLPGGAMLQKLDAAVVGYRDHKTLLGFNLLLSMALHTCLALSAMAAGYALGMRRPFGLVLTVVPLAFLGGSLPISYQGLGVMEVIARPLLVDPPMCTFNQVVGMLMFARFYQMFFSLVGVIFLLRGDVHLHPPVEAES
ncbi:MAG: flippase-like domain-containing protein [Phycisphaera sp.]|nr:flippase-like domain-containing protein [Phycisphaera sp.]